MELAGMTMAEVSAVTWQVRTEPLIRPPRPSPIVADPTFLPPAPGRRGWHLWAHSLLGIHHFDSDDGIAWRRAETVARNALRAHVVDLAEAPVPWRTWPDRYRLAYERTRFFLPIGRWWRSWIESRRGREPDHWSRPSRLLEPSLPWHDNPELGRAVSNPCLVPDGAGGWRLYYSAGLTLLPDCGFSEPTFIGLATSPGPDGPFVPQPEPLLGPDRGEGVLAAGALKVVRVSDGWIGWQNRITWNGSHSGSEIWVLGSPDGGSWRPLADKPALTPTGHGWMATHVYALDVRDTPAGVRMYFNARDGYHWTRGRERIGLAEPA